jgi:hypothetical protein
MRVANSILRVRACVAAMQVAALVVARPRKPVRADPRAVRAQCCTQHLGTAAKAICVGMASPVPHTWCKAGRGPNVEDSVSACACAIQSLRSYAKEHADRGHADRT